MGQEAGEAVRVRSHGTLFGLLGLYPKNNEELLMKGFNWEQRIFKYCNFKCLAGVWRRDKSETVQVPFSEYCFLLGFFLPFPD